MKDITRALSIMPSIREFAGSRASSLTRVPVDSVSPADAVRILQVQIFALTDAVSDLAEAVRELQNRRR